MNSILFVILIAGLASASRSGYGNPGFQRQIDLHRQSFGPSPANPPGYGTSGYRPQPQSYRPQPQSYRPQAQGYSFVNRPQAQSYRPQSQSYAAPQPQSYRPQSQSYAAPQPQSYSPQSQSYAAPQPQSYTPQSQSYAAPQPQSQSYAAPQPQSYTPQTQTLGQYVQPQVNAINYGGDSLVHNTIGSQEYHYSWRVDSRKFTGQQAAKYCLALGNGWRPISINNKAEDALVVNALVSEKQDYTWTGGRRSYRAGPFVWDDGTPITYSNWSYTGSLGQRQPDNSEGNEDCLAVLDGFYQDGVVWHDVACHHEKPVICERGSGVHKG